jgi:Amt family ammonium transporter
MSSEVYYPNYGYVGAPANYNGTGTNGGDSGKSFFFRLFITSFEELACLIFFVCLLRISTRQFGFLVKIRLLTFTIDKQPSLI